MEILSRKRSRDPESGQRLFSEIAHNLGTLEYVVLRQLI
jgi:hypothetical protein